MPAITNELIDEVLKKVQEDSARTCEDTRGIREELSVIRGHVTAMQRDIHNIYDRLGEHTERLDRIERRLDLSPAAP